ncbi:MAG TPA: hypothetical protein VN603_11400 [Candidatus Acidoferrales bacterium]|nr:hypothetical protein [Candidatus Acidoferrales bacterium]
MHTQAAEAARADAPACPKIDWSHADDDTLVRGLLKKDDFAGLELLYRIDALTTERIQKAIRRRSRMLCSTDLVDDIQSDVAAFVEGDNMRPLRAFDARHGTLASWLCRVADQMTMRRLQMMVMLDDEEG